jgi:hypothetical protein
MPDYLILSTEKTADCEALFHLSRRIAALLQSQKIQSNASMQASLDDLLGAVYSLIYARNYDYDDRQQSLGPKDIGAVKIRATDMAAGKVRTEGKWTAGFYFNNALFRISAVYHRALKIIAGRETEKVYVDKLRPTAETLFQTWRNQRWTSANLINLHKEVNELKHTADGIFQGRDVKFDAAIQALDELLNLIEAWAAA